MTESHVLVAPNQDGYGPSALCSYIVHALLLSRAPIFRVTIWNSRTSGPGKEYLYNKVLFSGEPRVTVVPVDNVIELDKPHGRTSIPGTLAKIGNYRNRSNDYPGVGEEQTFDLVLDFGVPAAARWARRKGMRSISVFDHCWSKTLELVLDDLEKTTLSELSEAHWFTEDQRKDWLQLIEEVKVDERETQTLFLFPPFITPNVFWRHWREEVGVAPLDLGGVLGGRSEWTRTEAREFLQITETGRTILIQAGDTPAWDELLPQLVNGFVELEGQLEVNVRINVPGRFQFPELDRLRRVRKLGSSGGTIQKVLPAVDFMVTRAGGGSVNDAVACRVPFVCVDEPGHAQVRAILEACLERKLTRSIPWNTFRNDPVRVARSQWEDDSTSRENHEFMSRLRGIPYQAEKAIVEAVCS